MKLEAVKIKITFIDWSYKLDMRNFHDYSTIRETTYNTYLLIDDKITFLIQ